jgi:hypothetical protein
MTGSPEIDLLLDGTLIHPDQDAVFRIRQRIERGLDWVELLRVAIPHGLLPLLSHNLSAYAASVVPPVTLTQLQLFGKRVADRNREQSLELVKLHSAFSRMGIRVISFKGPALAISCYGDIGLRESHDLDLWVDPLQVARAYEWFREAGYHPVKYCFRAGSAQGSPQVVSDFSEGEGVFFSPDRRVLIEVKGHLEKFKFSDFDPVFDEVWDRRSHTALGLSEIPVLAVEDLLLALAVHGSKHLWRRLNWIVDVAAMISSHAVIDWDTMLRRAKEWGCRRRLLVAVALARTFYGVELPKECHKATRDLAVRSAVSHIRSALFRQQPRTIGNVTSDVLYCLQCCDSRHECLLSLRFWVGRALKVDETGMRGPQSNAQRRARRVLSSARGWILSHQIASTPAASKPVKRLQRVTSAVDHSN